MTHLTWQKIIFEVIRNSLQNKVVSLSVVKQIFSANHEQLNCLTTDFVFLKIIVFKEEEEEKTNGESINESQVFGNKLLRNKSERDVWETQYHIGAEGELPFLFGCCFIVKNLRVGLFVWIRHALIHKRCTHFQAEPLTPQTPTNTHAHTNTTNVHHKLPAFSFLFAFYWQWLSHFWEDWVGVLTGNKWHWPNTIPFNLRITEEHVYASNMFRVF